MSYIVCCGIKCSVEIFRMEKSFEYAAIFVSILKRCPICGAYILEMRRYTRQGRLLIVRKSGFKAKKLLSKIQDNLSKMSDCCKVSGTVSTLNYNEFGKIKKCRSNLSRLSMGKFESLPSPFLGGFSP